MKEFWEEIDSTQEELSDEKQQSNSEILEPKSTFSEISAENLACISSETLYTSVSETLTNYSETPHKLFKRVCEVCFFHATRYFAL